MHPNQVSIWKTELIEGARDIVDRKRGGKPASEEPDREELLKTIGQLNIENDVLKKNLACSVEQKKMLINPGHPTLSVSRQCELLALPRSTYYVQPVGKTSLNLELMARLDEEESRHPFEGYRKMTKYRNECGTQINRKRVSRWRGELGLRAISPGPNLSAPGKDSKNYPSLLRDLKVTRPNQVWRADITTIRMQGGFVELTAVIDWESRSVLSWRLPCTLDSGFCIEALEEALRQRKPEIFNTDQGVQYTSDRFIRALETQQIRVSMDGKGRAWDNVFVERLWRTVKEEVYLTAEESVPELKRSLKEYIFYNEVRLYQSLSYQTRERQIEKCLTEKRCCINMNW